MRQSCHPRFSPYAAGSGENRVEPSFAFRILVLEASQHGQGMVQKGRTYEDL